MVRESRKNAAGPAGGWLPARAPPFGGIQQGVSTNPPRTHQHFFLILLGRVLGFFFFPSFSFFPSAQQIWRLLGRHHSHRDGAVVSRGMEGPPGMLLLAPAQGLQVGVAGKEGTSARAGNKVHVLGTHTEQTHKVIPVPQFPCPQLHGGDSLVLPGAARRGQDTHGLAIHISSLLLGRRGAGGSHLFLGGSAPASP